MAKIFLTVSGKGGVGKTTLSASLGYCLAKRGKKVLLIELDAGLRSLDAQLGLSQEITFDLSDVLCGRCEPVKALYQCSFCENLQMMPAPFNENFFAADHDFNRLCNGLKHYWDYIIIDGPAGVGKAITSACAVADVALIVSPPDEVAVRDAAKASIVVSENGVTDKRLIINKADRFSFNLFSSGNIDYVIDTVGARLLGVIPNDRKLHKSSATGAPLNLSSPAGQALSNIAARLDGCEVPLKFNKF